MQGTELYNTVEPEIRKLFETMQNVKEKYKITSLHLESCNGMEQFWYSQGKGAAEMGEPMTDMETKEARNLKGERNEQRIKPL